MSAIVVTGWGITTASGEGPIDTPTWSDTDGLRASRAVLPVRQLWPGAPERVGRMDRLAANALLAAARAVERAGMTGAVPTDAAVVLGTSLGCAEVNERYHRGLVERGAEGASPLLFAQTIPSTPIGEVAIAFGARGHASTVMAGRASGIAALIEARRALSLRRATVAIVLAVDTVGSDRLRMRASRGEPPCAEAAVALVVEAELSAREAGRVALATLDDAYFMTDTHGGDAGVDWLGASGIVELVSWLVRGTTSTFEVRILAAAGSTGVLRATRVSASAT